MEEMEVCAKFCAITIHQTASQVSTKCHHMTKMLTKLNYMWEMSRIQQSQHDSGFWAEWKYVYQTGLTSSAASDAFFSTIAAHDDADPMV